MAKVYYDNDANLELIKSKTIAIIGYGIQGRGQALCLRDSGCNVIVSELAGTDNYNQAKQDGFDPIPAEEAAKKAKLTQEEIEKFKIIKEMAYIKDARDDFRRKGVYYIRKLFEEISKRMKISIEEIAYLTQAEILDFLDRKKEGLRNLIIDCIRVKRNC